MGVSNAWGADVQKDAIIYFDNSASQWSYAYHYFAINESYGYKMTKVDNTLLYVHKRTDNTWGGYNSIRLFATTSSWGDPTASELKGYNNMTSYGANITNTYTNYGFNANNYYYIKPDQKGSTSSHANISVGHLGSSYSSLNKTITIKAKVSTNGGSSYSDANTPAKLTGSSKVFTAYNSCAGTTDASATLNAGSSSTTFKAGYTANTTLTAVAATGYTFVGWYSGDTKISDQLSITVNPTGATTYYAHYKANQYTINYKDQGGSNFSGTHASGYPTTHTYGTATTLKTASKTGYTFEGWYPEAACTNKVTSLGATAYTANIILYAKWTEKPKYTVTISSDGNGTVTPNTPQQVGEIPVPITATANDGYKFKNWTKTGNVAITNANSASTTITATGIGTVTANFETANRIYLKPAGDNDWEKDVTPRYAVYVIDDQSWHDMTKINNDIYYCDIKPTYRQVIFCRMDPNTAANNWANRWTQTEDLTLPDNCNLFDIAKDASTANNVNATGTWMEYNAWHLAGAFNEWTLCGQTFKEQEDGSFTFTQHLEAGNTYEFKLVHNGEWYGNNGTMVRGTSTGWTMSTSENNCKITADYAGNYTFMFDASTKKLTVRYPILITLGSSMFGPYGISYNGQSYFSKDDADVVISLPYGATINFIEGQPYSDIYTGGIMEKDKTRQFDLTQPYTIERDIRFDANYVTKVPQVAYLGVPNSLSGWAETDTRAQYIWRFDSQGDFAMEEVADRGTFEFEVDGVKYYKYTIKAGCNKFQFQHKTKSDSYYNQKTTHHKTNSYLYEVLTTDVNCYMLDGGTYGDLHTGYWCALPAREGDYRLLYVEQVVEKDADGYTIITRKKAHPSDIIRKGTASQIVSLHTYKERTYTANAGGGSTYTSSNNPEIILQKYLGNDQWQDIECQMVYGPLETLPVMGQLPGRKNASSNSAIDDLKLHNGIENIKNDTHEDQGNGVWNFVVTQDNDDNASVQWNQTHRYTGEYYIRTNAAFGEWNSYKGSDNHMTRSDVSKQHSNYSHYYCKWVKTVGTNVKFTIANDYGMAISDTLTADATTLWGDLLANADKMVTGETLPASANVRFSWNEKSNFLHRAYLAGSTDVASRFLVLEGQSGQLYDAEGNALAAGVDNGTDPRFGLNANEEIFNDISNWVYQADVQMIPKAEIKLTAKYNNKVQYFIGKPTESCDTILSGTGSQKYLIRLLYDFKTNELISAYVPGGNSTIEPIQTNLMLLRKENETPRQLSFTTNNMNEVGKRAYGVLELTQETLEDPNKTVYERSLYWISFPFDVRITDIFGFGEYGKHWIIQSYDGEKRAREGLWADSETNWVYHFDPNTLNAGTPDAGIMKKGVGYVVALNLKNIQAESPFVGRITTLALYFPSTSYIAGHIVNANAVSISVPKHECTINRPTPDGDRRIKDSHWNVIGVPSYINAVGDFTGKISTIAEDVKFYYSWQGDYDKYEVVSGKSGVSFNSLNAYMVQFAGNLQWTNVLNEAPAGMAAKRNSDNMQEHHLCLELQQNGNEQDRTFIQLQEDEVTTAFDFNYDLCKIINKGANIYSLIATDRDPIEVAGNVLPVEEAIIPLGIKLDAAGEYTFAMPDGTDGITVELIDYENNTRTNMLFDDYTVNLTAGTNEARFALHVKPDKTASNVEHITTPSCSDIRKFIIDGVLYMQKDGILYDAQGKLVR